MRNQVTKSMEQSMNRAFEKSKMTLKEFIQYLARTRDIFDFEECEDYVSFQIIKDGQVYEFFYAYDEWYCKQ